MQASKDCLGPGSAVARALPGFRARPQQLEMAEAVEEAIAENRHLVVEAGTGVGKSFSYLVPALLDLDRSGGGAEGGPIVVATRTIALQEQLVGRDIPFLIEALGLEKLKIALAKGRGNYVCLRRLELACTEGSNLFRDARALAQLERLRSWAHESSDGSVADLSFRPIPEVWDAVKAEAGNCLGKRCRFYGPCAFQRSRREMYGADLLVANHALIFADLVLREAGVEFLPPYRCLILDEAHELEEGAAENFGASVSELGILRQMGRFMGVRRRSGLFGRVEVAKSLYEQFESVRGAVRDQFQRIDALRGNASELRLRDAGAFKDVLSDRLAKLVRMLRIEHDSIEDDEIALEWKARTDRLDETVDSLRLIHGVLDSEMVYWVEGAGRQKRSRLRAAPAEVAPILRRTLFERTPSVILTSATLLVGGKFDHFERRVGLREPMRSALGSPFDFKSQCRLLLYPGLPDPRDPGYDPAIAERIRELVLESGGGAFVLFTSYRSLSQVHDQLRGDLVKAGLDVMHQGGEVPLREIVERFRDQGNCVLFGTDTFWQGIDVRGHNLRLVVLTRLPFAVPDHPLQQARIERIQANGGDPFRQLSLPQAVLKLRQGFGRLIRTHEDRGAVAILDPRVRTKRYGRIFLDSLPECALEERD